MQTQPKVVESNGGVLEHAVGFIQSNARDAAAGSEKLVRRYPFASVGVALGGGIALGFAAHWLLAPKRPRSLLERVGVAAVVATAARGLTKLF